MSRAPGCSLVVVSVHDALEFLAGLTVEIIGQVVEALYEPFPEGIALGIPPEAGAQLLEHLTCQLEKLLLLIKRGRLGWGWGYCWAWNWLGSVVHRVLPIMGWWSGWNWSCLLLLPDIGVLQLLPGCHPVIIIIIIYFFKVTHHIALSSLQYIIKAKRIHD